MITLFNGTNRPDNKSIKLATAYAELLREKGVAYQLCNMESLPPSIAFSETYGNRSEGFQQLIHAYVDVVDKFVFIVPEYNGSYPGIVKVFLDAVEPRFWHHKKVALVGLGSGRGGNLRGLDHLTGVFHYLRAEVFSFKPAFSGIDAYLDVDGVFSDPASLKLIELHIAGFLKF